MNRNIKKVIYNILENDKLAREDDWHLIQQTLTQMLPCSAGTAFGQVLQVMKVKGISFEAITRQRKKFLEENSHLRNKRIDNIQKQEKEEYYMEYSNHIPRIN